MAERLPTAKHLDALRLHLVTDSALCGERGVGIFADRILAACRRDPELGPHVQAHVVNLDGVTSLDQLWADLTRHVS